ncbi:MAG TPA: AMP-binding protein [Saprospiraceae bacterium]|nr:AMP-binding protein [Saprospiraceae bacterium]HRG41141.1 AMP-binding protein [Saprospiraceae bacterium]
MNNRPWLRNYPPGIPVNIDTTQYETLVDFLKDCFTKYSKLNAFECMGKKMTYAEADRLSTQFGAYLHSRGLKPGDRIALMMPNLLQYPIAVFGALKAGLIIVNTNPMYTPREMLFQFEDSGVKAIVIVENFAANLESVISKTQIETVIMTSIGEMLGSIKGSIVNFAVRYIKRLVPKYNLSNVVSFSHALEEGKKFKIKEFQGRASDVIVHQYTGGTTGVSKGAMLTNANLVSNMLQIRTWMQNYLEEGKEITLSPLPMYHIFAFSVNCLAMLSYGAHTVLVTNARDLSSIVKEFNRSKISLMTGLNTLFNALLNNEEFRKCDFSSLKITVGGGMAIQRVVADRWKEVTGCPLTEGYGMTESSPLISVNPLDGGKVGSIGLPVSSTDIRIMKEDGTLAGYNEIGEIQCKGPQVMAGYYKQPDETSKAIIDDGWLCTGDIGRMDEEGYMYIVDRKKDMILVSGFNVFPNEIENVVVQHPKVLEVAAIGVPDDKSGEVVKIFVVKKDDSLTKDELMAYCKSNLTGYKMPKHIEFRDELPKTNVGKILRRALKE